MIRSIDADTARALITIGVCAALNATGNTTADPGAIIEAQVLALLERTGRARREKRGRARRKEGFDA